jgi:NAD(P)H-flavin reductase/hemoglobin-like flavoprotein
VKFATSVNPGLPEPIVTNRVQCDTLSVLIPAEDADSAMTYFYGQLFAMDTEVRAMFPAAMDRQRARFFQALTRIAAGQDDRAYLADLGRAHRKFGVREQHYGLFRRALMATLRRFAPSGDHHAFLAAFDDAIDVMIEAARQDAEDSPAWWIATVTGAERRAPDIAVLTLQPEQPLSYLPGQHVSVQTPHWPRMWRRYSVANAPRPDGSLRLHVRAVTGGLVSPALVHQVQPGDPLILGPAGGTMTAGPHSTRDVLCLAGGTGLAPVKAVIEAVIAASVPVAVAGRPVAGRRREIVLYHGARRRQDLYDLAELREMERAHPGLRVIAAVSQETAAADDAVVRGTVPELAAEAAWADRDIYISGPDGMIVKTAQVLAERGAPSHLIHYDLG